MLGILLFIVLLYPVASVWLYRRPPCRNIPKPSNSCEALTEGLRVDRGGGLCATLRTTLQI